MLAASALSLDRADNRAERIRVDDHDHAAIAQNGIAGEHGDIAQQARHRLHHDFLGAEHAIDQHAEQPRADLDDHDGKNAVRPAAQASAARPRDQQLGQVQQRQQLVAQAQHRRVVDQLDLMAGGVAGADQLDDAVLRDGEAVPAASTIRAAMIASVSGILMVKVVPAAEVDLVDGAADRLDIGAHDVHADAAARNVVMPARWRTRPGR